MRNERRAGQHSDSGRRRRKTDPVDDFALFRDRALLAIGGAIVVVIAAAAIFVDIKNPEVALAALTLGGGLLGAPSMIRLDEARQRRRGER